MEVDLCFDTTSLVNLDTVIPNITVDVFVSLDSSGIKVNVSDKKSVDVFQGEWDTYR